MALDTLFTMILIIFVSVLSGIASESNIAFEVNKREMQEPIGDLDLIESLDDDVYEEFLNELPIWRQVLVGDRKKKTLRVNASALKAHAEPRAPTPATPRRRAGRTARYSATRWRNKWSGSTTQDGRRGLFRSTENHVISCYVCGLNESLLPKSRICHDLFEVNDGQIHALARFFRAACYFKDQDRYYDKIMPSFVTYPKYVKYDGKKDIGVRVKFIGPYRAGCVKRYVDVGPLYTQRACRGRKEVLRPYRRTLASHRLSRLEFLAWGHKDVCVHSPHASLTPFSRSVSLFVRYHVCVCNTYYCNASNTNSPSQFVRLFTLFCIAVMLNKLKRHLTLL